MLEHERPIDGRGRYLTVYSILPQVQKLKLSIVYNYCIFHKYNKFPKINIHNEVYKNLHLPCKN